MRCVSCGMMIKGKAIREEIEGHAYHYCCPDCFEEELCRRDKPLRKARARRPLDRRRTPHGHASRP